MDSTIPIPKLGFELKILKTSEYVCFIYECNRLQMKTMEVGECQSHVM